jgi:flavin reductase (DIM6/NTAB) family NADH-FMN oxidoreductase RutF
MTVSSFSSVSLEPPLVSVNIERRTRTHELIQASGSFAVCILSSDQQELAERFGGGIGDAEDRFSDLEFSLSGLGNPVPVGCLAVLDCRTVASHPAGTHSVVIGEAVAIQGDSRDSPLVYFNRSYRRLW